MSEQRLTGKAVAVEFVTDGDPHRDDPDDEPRPAGTYLTIRLDDPSVSVGAGRVAVDFLK